VGRARHRREPNRKPCGGSDLLVHIYKALGGGWADKPDGLEAQPMAGSVPVEDTAERRLFATGS
jgi:hypothetical protein